MIRIALSKGKLFEEAAALFGKAGIRIPEEILQSRKLHVTDQGSGLTFLAVRAQDVPTYVAQGAADVGVVGRDVLQDRNRICTRCWNWESAPAGWFWRQKILLFCPSPGL